jgi:hypothetical protein
MRAPRLPSTTFVTVAWQEARTRDYRLRVLELNEAFVNYLKKRDRDGQTMGQTRTTGERRNVGRQRAIVYVGNYMLRVV